MVSETSILFRGEKMKLLLPLLALAFATLSAQATEPTQPTFLPEMNANPQPGPYLDVIEKFKAAGKEPLPIWYLYAYRNEVAFPVATTAQKIVRGDASIAPGLRELIGAYVSALNNVPFCEKIHSAAAATLLANETLVAQVMKDPETSSLTEKEKALFRYAKKLTTNMKEISSADVEELKRLGWTDEGVYYLISTVSFFSFFNRWVAASGVKTLSDETMKEFGQILAQKGYAK